MKRITINEEIESLKGILRTREDTSHQYLSPELRELQGLVIAAHARLDSSLDIIIALHLQKRIRKSKITEVRYSIQHILSKLSFRDKTGMVAGYDDVPASLVENLGRVNRYRIEFAHPDGTTLRREYDYRYPATKQNIRDLLRSLNQTEGEMDQYLQPLLSKLNRN